MYWYHSKIIFLEFRLFSPFPHSLQQWVPAHKKGMPSASLASVQAGRAQSETCHCIPQWDSHWGKRVTISSCRSQHFYRLIPAGYCGKVLHLGRTPTPTLVTGRCWGPPSRKAAWQKRTWGSCWTLSWTWASKEPLPLRKLMVSWVVLGKV